MSEKYNPGTLASISFRTIAHFYDSDDPSPEYDRELTDRAENAIVLSVLDVPDKKISPICDHIELQFPPSDLTPERQTAIVSATKSHFKNRSSRNKKKQHPDCQGWATGSLAHNRGRNTLIYWDRPLNQVSAYTPCSYCTQCPRDILLGGNLAALPVPGL